MNVVLVAGTWHAYADWITNPNHPFQQMLKREGFVNVLNPLTRQNFVWSGRLSGLPFIGCGEWKRAARQLCEFIEPLSYGDLNFIAHSHGGQVVINAAAQMLGKRRFRTITTISTPRRHDMPARDAVANCAYWQHVFDAKRDWIATMRKRLGGLGDWNISADRSFSDVPGVVNIPVPSINHSRLFGGMIEPWFTYRILDGIRGPHRGD